MNSQRSTAEDAGALGSAIVITPLPKTAPESDDDEDEVPWSDPGDLDGDYSHHRIETLDLQAEHDWQTHVLLYAQQHREYGKLALSKWQSFGDALRIIDCCESAMQYHIHISDQTRVALAFRSVDDLGSRVFEFYYNNLVGWEYPVSIHDPRFNPGRWAFNYSTWEWHPIDGSLGRRLILNDGDIRPPPEVAEQTLRADDLAEAEIPDGGPAVYAEAKEWEIPPWTGDSDWDEEARSTPSPADFLLAAGPPPPEEGATYGPTSAPVGPNDIPATWHWEVPITMPWRERGVGRGAYITYHYHDEAHNCTVYTGHGPRKMSDDLVDDVDIPDFALDLLRRMARPVRVSIHEAPEIDDGRFPPGANHGQWWPRVSMVDICDIALGIVGPEEGDHVLLALGVCGYPLGHALFSQPREECVCNRYLLNSASYAALLTHPNLSLDVQERFATLNYAPRRFEAYSKPAIVRFVAHIPRLLDNLPDTALRFFKRVAKEPDLEVAYVSVVMATALEEIVLIALGVASPWLAAAGALALATHEACNTSYSSDSWFKLCAHVGLASVRRFSGIASWLIHAVWNALVFMCAELRDDKIRDLLLSGKHVRPPTPRHKRNNAKADADGRRTVPKPSARSVRMSKQAQHEYIANRPLEGMEPDSEPEPEEKEEEEPAEEPLPANCWTYFPCSPGLGNGPMTMHLSNGDTIRHRVCETESYPSVVGASQEWAELCHLADAILCNNIQSVVNPSPCARSLIAWLVHNREVKVEHWTTSGLAMAPVSNAAYQAVAPRPPLLKLGFAFHFDKAYTGPIMGFGCGIFRALEPSSSSLVSGMGPLTLEQGAEHYRTTSHPAQGFYSEDEIDFSKCAKVRHQPVYYRDPSPSASAGATVRVNTFESRDYVAATPYALHYLDGAEFPVKVGPAYKNGDGSVFYPYRLLRDVPHPFGLIDLRVLVEASKSPQIKSGNENAWSVAAHKAAAAMTSQPGASRDALVATAISVLAYAQTRKDMRSSVTAAVLNGTIRFDRIGSGWRELFAGRADILPRAEAFMAMHPGVANLLNWVVAHSLSPYGGWMLALLQAVVGFIPSLYPRSDFKHVMGEYLEPSVLHFAGHNSCCYIEREARNYIPTKQPDFNLRPAQLDPAHNFVMRSCDDLVMSVRSTPAVITHTRQIQFLLHTVELRGNPRPCFLAGPLCLHAAATYSSLCTVAALCLRQGMERPPLDWQALDVVRSMGLSYIGDYFPERKNDLEIDPDDYEAWLACQKPNVRLEHKKTTEAGEWPSSDNCDCDGTAFTKTELHKPVLPDESGHSEPGLPRVIVDSRPSFNRYTAPDVFRLYHDPVFGNAFNGQRSGNSFRHLYSPGCKGETLTQHFLGQCCDLGEGGSPCLVVLGDVTKWDAHIRPDHIQVMLAWYRRLGFTEQSLACFLRKATSSARVKHDKLDGNLDFVAGLDGTVKSGVPDTTFGNTLLNIFMMSYSVGCVVNGNTNYRDWLYKPAVTASGDDSVVILHREGHALRGYLVGNKPSDVVSFNAAVANVCLTLGFRVKVHSNLHGINGISYCGGRFYPVMRKTISCSPPFAASCNLPQTTVDVYYAFGNSVKRQLFKCGFISQPHWEHATAVWAGTMVQQGPLYNHIPFLGTFWRAQLPIAKASRQERPQSEDHKIFNSYSYEPLGLERSFRYDYLVDDDGEPFTFGDYTLSQAHRLIEERYGKLADALLPDRTLVLADPLITSALRGEL